MAWQQQIEDRIYFDSGLGVPGTTWPIGTPGVPSDVIADVITMCGARNLRTISVHGALTLGAAMKNYNFIGSLHQEAVHAIDLNGHDVDSSHIYGIIVTGAQGGTGFLSLEKVTVNALTLFAGRMRDCDFYTSTCSFRDASFINLIDCQSISGVVTITVQAPTRASIKNWRGNLILTAQDGGTCFVRGFKGTLEIDAMTAGTLSVYANGADITINADCTGGTINIYGDAEVTGAGGGVTINKYTLQERTKGLDDIHDDLGTHETSQATHRAALGTHDTDIKALLAAVALEATLGTHDTDIKALLATIAAYIDTEIAAIETKLDTPANFMADVSALALEATLAVVDGIVDNILLDTQIRKTPSGVKVINAGITKYLHIDSGTNGAEILSIAIEGVIGHDWTLDVYVPAADAEAATQAKSKRDAITYAAADTEGGLLGPFGIPFDCYLDFTNNGVNDQIDQVTVTYRSRGALTLTWEA